MIGTRGKPRASSLQQSWRAAGMPILRTRLQGGHPSRPGWDSVPLFQAGRFKTQAWRTCMHIHAHASAHMCRTLFLSPPCAGSCSLISRPASCTGNLPGALGLSFLGRPMPATAYLRDLGHEWGQHTVRPTGLQLLHTPPTSHGPTSFTAGSLPGLLPSFLPVFLHLTSLLQSESPPPCRPILQFLQPLWSLQAFLLSKPLDTCLSFPSPFPFFCFFSLLWLPLASPSLSPSFSSHDFF